VIGLKNVSPSRELCPNEPVDIIAYPQDGSEKPLAEARFYMVFCGQLVCERRHRERGKERASGFTSSWSLDGGVSNGLGRH
jgi:hypothetical protein